MLRRQATEGRPLDLQAARRGELFTARVRQEQLDAAGRGTILRGGLEHPRQRWIGPRDDQGRPALDSAGYFVRQYRRPSMALRWLRDVISDEYVLINAHGRLLLGVSDQEFETVAWRRVFTGSRQEAIDRWDKMMDGWYVNTNWGVLRPEYPMFETIDRLELMWGPGI